MTDAASHGSVSQWLEDLRQGDRASAEKLWQRYYARLLELTKAKLSRRHAKRRIANEEDVVASVLESVIRRTEEGRFPDLQDRDGLWRLLLVMTERKVLNLVRKEHGGIDGRTVSESVFARADKSSDAKAQIDVMDKSPTPEFAASLVDEADRLLTALNDDLRAVALFRLEGFTNREIADRIKRSQATVERRLQFIRRIWEQMIE